MAKTKRVRLWTPETGLTVYTHITYRPDDQDSTLTILDSTDGKFRETSVAPYSALTEHATVKGLYVLDEDVTEWKDGFYEARFWSQLAGAPAPSTDDILAVRPTRVKITFDTLLAVFETTDLKKLIQDQTNTIVAGLGVTIGADYEGVATGGSNTTIVEALAMWNVDIWASVGDLENLCVVESLASGERYGSKIVSNTNTTLTVNALAGGYTVVAGDKFYIKRNSNAVDIKSVGGTVQTGGDWTSLLTDIDTNTTAPTTPVIYNISIAAADTQYSQALPANTKKFALSIIDGTIGENFRFAYVTGKVATPTAPYRQLDQGFEYSQDGVNSSATVYVAASNICVAQLEVWS